MNGNDFVKLMLRSPLRVLAPNTMLITVTGRRSGRKYTLPVDYYRDGDTLWILSRRDRSWWRNLRPAGSVEMQLHGEDLTGVAEVVENQEWVAAGLGEYVRHLPMSGAALGVRLKDGVADQGDAKRAARDRLLVRVAICQTAQPSADVN